VIKIYIRRVKSGKRKGEFFVTMKGKNGEKLNNSETYKRRAGAQHYIAVLEAAFRSGNFDIESEE